MTEEEAKTKYCPYTFTRLDERDSNGYGITQGGPWMCCATGCMAWRWGTSRVLFNPTTKEVQPVVWGQSYDGSKFIVLDQEDKSNGYCGLAGTP